MIPYELKRKCVELKRSGVTARDIYYNTFVKEHQGMSFETFRRKIQIWNERARCDDYTLDSGTYSNMVAHGATVQVNGSGEIVQAWIKQSADDNDWKQVAEMLTKDIEPVCVDRIYDVDTGDMLEIPLFDMHFGVATLADYANICAEIIELIKSKSWNEINLIIGQDLIHTNDMRGHTAKGTPIGSIDFVQAWQDAWTFWNAIITASIANAETVYVRYSKGNHDECTAWCFVEAVKAKYPQVKVDDEIKPRKAIVWNGCFIGYGHCEYGKSPDKLFRDFVIDFPSDFASCKVREIHTGHLHSESTDNGMIVRRLASAVPCDEWSTNNGYIGSHKRFQLFAYGKDRLKTIHYV